MNQMWRFLKDKQCYSVLFGCFLIELSLGSYYSVENIEPYLVMFMNKSSMENGYISPGSGAWILGLMAFGFGTTVSFGGILAESIGSSMTVLIGGWIMSLNFALTYYTCKSYMSVVAISYGLLCGMGGGLGYGVAFGVPCKYFPKNNGLIIGIVLSGFGISSAIFDRIQITIVQIESERELDNLPISFIALGLIYASLQFLGSILIKDKSEKDEEILTVNSISNEYSRLHGAFDDLKCSIPEQKEIKTHHLLLEFDFWILWLTMFVNSASLLIFQHLYLRVGKSYFNNSEKSFLVLTALGSIFNSLGRIFWGFLIDRKSYKLVMLFMTIPLGVTLSTFATLLSISNANVFYYLYGVWISVINLCLSGTYVVFPAMCAKLYGLQNFISNYGFLFTASSVSTVIISPITVSFLITGNQAITTNAFIIAGVILLISIGLTLMFRGKSLVLNKG